MDSDGFSTKHEYGPLYCFLMANDTVGEMPLAIENFTAHITRHATDFIWRQTTAAPFYFLMSYFHVHTPLFTNRTNRGRSRGGDFGDNVEECDDSIGEVLQALEDANHSSRTLVMLTSDNGPYQEEGWSEAGRSNLYDAAGKLIGRLRGGKGQLFEGGVRMPGVARWPGIIPAGSVSSTLVSTLDIFPTVLAAAGINMSAVLPAGYVIDGRDFGAVLRDPRAPTAHTVFLHYCGFTPIGARVHGRYKVFWATQRWHTFDPANYSICTECCNGVVPAGKIFFGVKAHQMCQCDEAALEWHGAEPVVFDLLVDLMESIPLNASSWPHDAPIGYAEVVSLANTTRDDMVRAVHPKPSPFGAGTCTEGLPATSRQPCCPGCHKPLIGGHEHCVHDGHGGVPDNVQVPDGGVCTCGPIVEE
jgi:steryl-sulfatase